MEYKFKAKDTRPIDAPRLCREATGNVVLVTGEDPTSGIVLARASWLRRFTRSDGLTLVGRTIDWDWGYTSIPKLEKVGRAIRQTVADYSTTLDGWRWMDFDGRVEQVRHEAKLAVAHSAGQVTVKVETF